MLEEAVRRAREHANLPLDVLLGRVQQPVITPTPRKPLSVEVPLV